MRGLKLFGLVLVCLGPTVGQESQDWTHFVRIAGHGVNVGNVGQIIRSATHTHVFGIEVDNDISGRYESFVGRPRSSTRCARWPKARTRPATTRSHSSRGRNASR